MTLLHLLASPRGERSNSTAVAQEFIAAYRSAHPDHAIDVIDLWATELPAFDGDALAAKYAVIGGTDHTPQQAKAWADITRIADRFKSASELLVSTPMWNFGIPYVLKHYIDVITQPGLTFTVTPEGGYAGLVTGRRATVVSSSGGAYHAGSGAESLDFERPYVEGWLRFIGFTDIASVTVAPTFVDHAAVEASRAAAIRRIGERAKMA